MRISLRSQSGDEKKKQERKRKQKKKKNREKQKHKKKRTPRGEKTSKWCASPGRGRPQLGTSSATNPAEPRRTSGEETPTDRNDGHEHYIEPQNNQSGETQKDPSST